MSLATLNRIVRETDVFYNTRRERDLATDGLVIITPPKINKWLDYEVEFILSNIDKPAKYFVGKINRSWDAILTKRRTLRRQHYGN